MRFQIALQTKKVGQGFLDQPLMLRHRRSPSVFAMQAIGRWSSGAATIDLMIWVCSMLKRMVLILMDGCRLASADFLGKIVGVMPFQSHKFHVILQEKALVHLASTMPPHR